MTHPVPQQALQFLKNTPPWHCLPEEDLGFLLTSCNGLYLTGDNRGLLDAQVQSGHSWVLVQNGDFEVGYQPDSSEQVVRFIAEGDYFFLSANDWVARAEQLLKVHTDGIVYCFAQQAIASLSEKYSAVQQFFQDYMAVQFQQTFAFKAHNWQEAKLSEMCQKQVVTADPETPIHTCAQIMQQHNVSSLMLCEHGELVGIVTDKDLRNRVLADARNPNDPVSAIMTPSPMAAQQDNDILDAVCWMSEHRFSHLPIVDNSNRPQGIISKTDILRQQRNNIGFLIKGLSTADNLYDLMQHAWQLPHFIRFNLQGNNGFAVVGQWLSRATDVMTRRLIGFYQEKQGMPPMQFAWLVYGSQARQDQLLTSDQDNALLLERKPNPQEAEYFKNMADYVCGGLAKCGIKLCNGNIMASNPDLRLPLDEAVEEARRCVQEPTLDALMHFNIFLDVRQVAGSTSLFVQLQNQRRALLKTPIFLAALAREIESNAVPLNLFQRFVFDKKAKAPHCINLKEHAVATINSIVRLYALADGISEAATLVRLKLLSDTCGLSTPDRANLQHIWIFLNELRMRSQLQQSQPDNFVDIDSLAPAEKYQLKNAFKAIQRAQSAVLVKFSGGLGA